MGAGLCLSVYVCVCGGGHMAFTAIFCIITAVCWRRNTSSKNMDYIHFSNGALCGGM